MPPELITALTIAVGTTVVAGLAPPRGWLGCPQAVKGPAAGGQCRLRRPSTELSGDGHGVEEGLPLPPAAP